MGNFRWWWLCIEISSLFISKQAIKEASLDSKLKVFKGNFSLNTSEHFLKRHISYIKFTLVILSINTITSRYFIPNPLILFRERRDLLLTIHRHPFHPPCLWIWINKSKHPSGDGRWTDADQTREKPPSPLINSSIRIKFESLITLAASTNFSSVSVQIDMRNWFPAVDPVSFVSLLVTLCRPDVLKKGLVILIII